MHCRIEPGIIVFIDANIFLYAVSGHWKFGNSSKCFLSPKKCPCLIVAPTSTMSFTMSFA
jgi:hypothetical protein